MKFIQFIENSGLSFSSPITKEEWDQIPDVEFERTEEITFRTPSGKEVLFRKVKPGEWYEEMEYGMEVYTCSECGFESANNSNFCPNCGADMKKIDADNKKSKKRWIPTKDIFPFEENYRCPDCMAVYKTDFDFCPNCGADMRI